MNVQFSDDGAGAAAAQMRRDAELFAAAEAGDATLRARCYAFVPAAVTAGAYEKNVPAACVRRPTGGRRLYHHADFAYAVAGPASHPLLAGGIAPVYRRLGACWLQALAALGVTATLATGRAYGAKRFCCETLTDGDVLVDGRKLVASAQRRGRTGVLQHGSIWLQADYAAAAAALGCDERVLRATVIPLAEAAGRKVSYGEVAAAWHAALTGREP